MQKQKITYSLFIIILSVLFSFQVKAQIYPIQVNTQLIPPYSLRLSDYVSPGTNRVSVNMLLTDINIPEYYTRLELLIEGAGITIRTSPTFNPGPIILQGGIPEFLTSSDLYEWFQPQNLDFSGYSKSDYLATGRLPEGVYRISFVAYDFYKRTRVSNNTAITTWLLLNDPPIINLPFPDYKVEHIDPQNIVFQWTPRHTGSPNSAFTTEYEFTMVEIWPEGRDPNNAMQTSFPIFQTTTTNTNLVYGLAEPFLEPGRQYAYQIQARDMDERDMFKNNGYSEVRMFTFGEACKPITNIEAKAEKYFEAEISWTPGFNQTAFSVRYRKANYPDAEWFEKDSYLDHIKLSNLEELTTYEYQIMAYCGTYESDYSEIQTFTTPKQKVSSFECGAGEEISPITNHDPLPTLNEGDYIWSGSFMFEIKEATGSNGTFSGKAFAMIPYLGYIKLLAEFKNIKINTDNRVCEGEIKSVYNPDSPFILGLDTDNDDDDNNGDNDNTTDGDESEISDTTFTSDIDSIYIEDDVIIIVTEDGTDTIHTTDDIIITDEDGDTWIVDGGEVVTGGGGTGPGGGGDPTGDGTTPAVSSTEEIKIKAEFIQNENQYYGFDKLKYDVHKPQYEQVSIYDKQEYVPWKSISSFGSDKVLVKISDSDASFTVDHVKYRTSSGIEISPFTYQGQEDTRMLMLNGKADTETEGIEAYVTYKNANDTTENEKEIVIGKLNTLSLDKLKINLVIVPVNGSAGFSETEFTNALNDIYQQSVVEWNVTVEDVYNINQDDWDKDDSGEAGYGKMNDGESTLFSNYSDEQIKFKRQYKSDRDMDNDAYYVFVMSDIPSKTGLAGYMPLKGQYAFIHSANSINAAQLIAHELGHGAFRLWHTFSSESDYYMAEKSSKNLMDYNEGEELHKYQWNKIHNPDGGFYMFQDEDEGAAYGNNCVFTEWIEKIRHAAQNNENITQNYGINEALENIKLSDNSYYSDIRIYSRDGFNVSISEENVEIHEYERTGETLTYFQFGEQIATSSNIPVYELEIITPTENKDKLFKYLFNKENWESEVRNHFINKMIDGRDAAVEFLDCLPDEYYKEITLLHRMDILNSLNEANNISENWFGSPNEEGVAIQIIKTTPEDQVTELFNRLEENGLIIDLYKKIDDVFGADNQTKFMCELLMLYYSQSQFYLNLCVEQTGVYCPWLKDESYSYNYQTNFEGSKINIIADYKYLLGGSGYETENNVISYKELSPFACIAVDFITVVDFIGIKGGVDGKVVPMPAIFFKWLNDEVIEREIEKVTELTIKIAAVSFSLGQLATAEGILEASFAITTLLTSTPELLFELNPDIKEILKETDEGEFFYETWQMFSEAINLSSSMNDFVQRRIPLIYLLSKSWEMLDDTNTSIEEKLGEDNYNKITRTIDEINKIINY